MSILLSELSSDPQKNHNISVPTGDPTRGPFLHYRSKTVFYTLGLFRTKIDFIYMINNKIVLLKWTL